MIHITLPARGGKLSRCVTPVAAHPDEHVLQTYHMQGTGPDAVLAHIIRPRLHEQQRTRNPAIFHHSTRFAAEHQP